MLRNLTWIVLLIFNSPLAKGQSLALVEQVSLSLYENKQWEDLHVFTHKHAHFGDSIPALLYRGALASYNLEKYHQTIQWLMGSKLVQNDTNAQQLLHSAYKLTGALKQSVLLDGGKHYAKHSLLSKIALEGGTKISMLENTGNLYNAGLSLYSRIGFRYYIKTQYSRSEQVYFWEKFQLNSFSVLNEYLFNQDFSLKMTYQLADYSSIIDFTEKNANPGFIAQGKVSQTIHAFTAALHRYTAFWQWIIGYTHFAGNGSSDYTARNLPGAVLFNERSTTEFIFSQHQLNTKALYILPMGKERWQFGLQINGILTNKTTYVQYIPEISYKCSERLFVYGNYWKKDRYLMAMPENGLFINNPLLLHQRAMLGIGYFLNASKRIDMNYFYEWGTDDLYKQKLRLHGIFLTFNHLFQP